MSFFSKISLRLKGSFSKKRGFSLLFLAFSFSLFFFFLFFPSSAGASLLSIVGLALSVAMVVPIVIAIYAFIILISQVFVQLSGALLNWVTSPGFVSISYTSPSGPNANLIVRAGLDITKNFVNLALVVILVYIAVAIALRLGENNAKRLFAKLIVVALLVNFAPLLVGLIVDASNIVMNYFLIGIKNGIANVLTQFSSTSGGILSQIYGLVTLQTSIIAKGFVMVILNFATGIALLLYAILFIFRYIAIWTLVILSPLAFVAWILPATKKYWDMWWSNLIQWSIIGIPMAFFLYLGARCYEVLPSLFKTQMETAGIGPEVSGLMNQTFPYFVVLAFLYLGFTLGLQTSAMGAKSIIAGFEKGRKATGKTAASRGWQWTKAGTGAMRAQTARIQRTYQAGRILGLPRYQAAGQSIARYWRRRALPAMRPAAIGRTAVAAGKGIFSAISAIAMAGAMASFGIKRKGFRKCPTCGNPRVARSAIACPTCGHVFP